MSKAIAEGGGPFPSLPPSLPLSSEIVPDFAEVFLSSPEGSQIELGGNKILMNYFLGSIISDLFETECKRKA